MTSHAAACYATHLYALVHWQDGVRCILALSWDRAIWSAPGRVPGHAPPLAGAVEVWEIGGAQRTLLEHLFAQVAERLDQPQTAHRLTEESERADAS